MKKYTFLVALMFHTAIVFAQGEFIVELSPETGTFVKVGSQPIQGIDWIYPGMRAYDEANGRMIFPAGIQPPDRLYSVETTTGNTVFNPNFPTAGGPSAVAEPQFDNNTGILYGVYYNSANALRYLVTIDPATGVHTQVGTTEITGLSTMFQGMTTYDEINSRYIVCAGTDLFLVDVQSNTTVSTPLSLQPGDALVQVCYNNANDTLYGLQYESSTQTFFLVWIDDATGAVTKIGSGTTQASTTSSATIDQAGRSFINCYVDQGRFFLSVVSLDDGHFFSHNQIDIPYLDNIANLKYDNRRQKLFAVHWDNELPTTTGISEANSGVASIYPNPASETLSVNLAKNYQDIQVGLYNLSGQQLSAYQFEQGDKFTFPLHDLSAGVYFLDFKTAGENFSVRFVKQ